MHTESVVSSSAACSGSPPVPVSQVRLAYLAQPAGVMERRRDILILECRPAIFLQIFPCIVMIA